MRNVLLFVDDCLAFIKLVDTCKVLIYVGKLHRLLSPLIHLAWQSYIDLTAFELIKVHSGRELHNFGAVWLLFSRVKYRDGSQRLLLGHE